MSYGIQIKNNDGFIQVDGEYSNLSLHEKGTWSSGGEGIYQLGFTTTSYRPTVVLRLDNVFLFPYGYYQPDTGEYDGTYIITHQAVTMDYMVFTKPDLSEIPNSGYGIVIHDVNGDPVFHSFEKWMKIAGFYNIDNPYNGDCSGSEGNYIDVTVDDADNNYFQLTPFCHYAPVPGICENDLYAPMMKKKDSTTIRIEVVQNFYDPCEIVMLEGSCDSHPNLNLLEIAP